MPTTLTTTSPLPYSPGDPVRFLVLQSGGTTMVNGKVQDVHRVDHGGFRIDVAWPSSSAREGEAYGRFYTSGDGSSDHLSAGHLGVCMDCGRTPIHVHDGTAVWRGPRAELVCATICQFGTAA